MRRATCFNVVLVVVAVVGGENRRHKRRWSGRKGPRRITEDSNQRKCQQRI